MKIRILFIAIVITLVAGRLQGQSRQQINNLATAAKVWGFLKYYHPAVAKGTIDWDAEWVKIALTITKTGKDKNFNRLLINWFRSLPKYTMSDNITQPRGDSILRVFDTNDIKKFGLDASLEQALIKLYLYHQPDSSKYITNRYGKYTLDYVWHNEEMFEKPAYPDAGHRLLALVRYWNIINYFYPHKAQNAPHWDKVLTNFIPQFINAGDSTAYRRTFLKLTAQLKDSHSFYKQKEWDRMQGPYNVPFRVYYVNGRYVIGSSKYDLLMKEQDFKIGDEIIEIDHQPIAKRLKELMSYTTGTNKLSFHRNIGDKLFKINGRKTVQVKFKRGNRTILDEEVKLFHEGSELYPYRVKHQPKKWEDLGNGVWYVRFCNIYDVKELKQMFTDIKDAKSLIWDMRDYPNFQMVQAMRPGLFAAPAKPDVNYNAMLFFPGAFKATNGAIPAAPDTLDLPLYKGKLIVLVNEFTQSLAESVASELRERPNTVIVGRQTAGTTGNILFVDFPGGIEASYTTVKVVGVNGNFEEGKGVKIDIPIKLSIKDLRSNADYELQQAYVEALKE